MSLFEKLSAVQNELKAPKGQYNSFGKYKYRSCEDILEAVKPILKKNGLVLTLSDGIEVNGDRIYVTAFATITDIKTGEEMHTTAYARESEEKKGMDESQITGTASSYARKYALNGLFLIDDTKDADTDEFTDAVKTAEKKSEKPSKVHLEALKMRLAEDRENGWITSDEEDAYLDALDTMNMEVYRKTIDWLAKKEKDGNKGKA